MFTAETGQTCMAIAYVGLLIGLASSAMVSAQRFNLRSSQRILFFWLVFDALIHICRKLPIWLQCLPGS